MLYNSDGNGFNRFNHQDENTVNLRQSVSVQMKIMINETSHPADAAFGISLFDLTELSDTHANAGKNLRILTPTITGSDPTFKVMLENDVIADMNCQLMDYSVENLVEYRVWQDVDVFKVEYHLNSVLQGVLDVPKSILTNTLKFRVGVTLLGLAQVEIYTLDINKKDKVAKTVRVQGIGQTLIPDGNSKVLLTGTGAPGKFTTFKLDRVLTSKVRKLVSGSILNDSVPDTRIDFGRIYGRNSSLIVFEGNVGNNTGSYGVCKTHDVFDTIQRVNLSSTVKINSCAVLNDVFYLSMSDTAQPPQYAINDIYTTTDFETFTLLRENLPFTYPHLKTLYVEGYGDVLLITGGSTLYYICYDGVNLQEVHNPLFILTPETLIELNPSFYVHNVFAAGWYSDDLLTWTQGAGTTSYQPHAVPFAHITAKEQYPYGNGIIAFKVYNQNQVAYSKDSGGSWLLYNHPVNFSYVIFGNGVFVLYSDKYTNTNSYVTTDFEDVEVIPNTAGVLGTSCHFAINKFLTIDNANGAPADFKLSADFKKWENIVTFPVLNKPITGSMQYEINSISDALVIRKSGSSLNSDKIVQPGKNSSIMGIILDTTVGVGTTTDGVFGPEVTSEVDGTSYNFPRTKTVEIAAPVSRVVNVSGTNDIVSYSAPMGSVLELTYIDNQYDGVLRNVFIGESCRGVDKVNVYADGDGGEYVTIVSKNSADCGYVADTLKTVVLNGQGVMEIPAGVTSVELTGRGSSLLPKVINTATTTIDVSFDHVANESVKWINEVAYAFGLYVVLCNGDNDYYRGSGYSESKEVWIGPSLDQLVKIPFVGNWKFNHIHFFKDKLIIRGYQDSNRKFLTCTSGGYLVSDWVESSPNYNSNAETRLLETPTHLISLVGTNYSISEDGVTFNNRTWYGSSWVRHYSNGLIYQNPQRIVSYGTYDRNEFLSSGYDWFLITYTTDGFVSNKWTSRAAENGHDSSSADPVEVANYTAVNEMFGKSNDAVTRRGVNSLAYGNGLYFGIVGYTYFNDYGSQETANGSNDVTAGFEIRIDGLDQAFTPKCYVSKFSAKAKVVFVDGVFIVTDVGRVFTSTDTVNWQELDLDQRFKNKIRKASSFNNKAYYQTKMSGVVYSSKKYVGDQYVVQLEQPGLDAVVTVDKNLFTFDGNKTSNTPATDIVENITLNPAVDTTIVYDCPSGSFVSIKYLSVNDGVTPVGTLIGTECTGFNEMGIYANGVGGTYEALIEANSLNCGYEPVVVRANISYPEQVEILELQSKDIYYSLNQPLDVDVSLTFTINHEGGASIADFDSIEYSVGVNALNPLNVGDTIVIPAGTMAFKIVIAATEDYVNEPLEISNFILTPSLNANRLVNTIISTRVEMTSNNLRPTGTNFDSSYTDEITSKVFNKKGIGFTDSKYMVPTYESVTTGKHSIVVNAADYENMIIGFADNSYTSYYNSNSHVYPGYDEYSWGFSSSGNYHNGVIVSNGPAWGANDKLTLLLDMTAGTAELLINNQSVGNVHSGITGYITMVVGTIDVNKSVSFYVNFGQYDFDAQSLAGIPDGYYLGFGNLTAENSWTPEYSPADDYDFTPSAMTGPVQGNLVLDGVVKIHSNYRSQTVVTTNDGISRAEITLMSNDNIRIGIHPQNFSGVAGTTADSWAIINNGLAKIHNNIQESLPDPGSPIFTITVIIDLIEGVIKARTSGSMMTLYRNIPTNANLVVSVATETTQANGGSMVFVNCGQNEYIHSANSELVGIGFYNSNPPAGTPITSYCSGSTKMVTLADGSGDTYDEVYMNNSVSCGYIPPDDNLSGWAYDLKGDEASYTEDGTVVNFNGYASLLGSIELPTGMHYWEVKDPTTNIYAGVANQNIDPDSDLTYNSNAFIVSLRDGWINNGNWTSGVESYYNEHISGKWVGFMLDLVNSKLSLKFEDGTIVEVVEFGQDPTPGPLRIALGSDGNYTGVLVNMGQNPFNNGIPVGYTSVL